MAVTKNTDPAMMAWDTEFFGIRMGRATHLDGVSQWAVDNAVGMICLLLDAGEPREIQKAGLLGFDFMDVRLTLERPTASVGYGARLLRLEDFPILRAIARESFRLTRFYADPRLEDERCDDLYEEWARSSFAGAADITLVSERDETPVGFVTVNLDGEKASIGLIAVAADHRGTGVGRELVSSAVNWARGQKATTMEVVTQGRNLGAIRTFEGCGFRVSKTEVWMHKHYEAS